MRLVLALLVAVATAQDGACWPAAPGEAADHDPGGHFLNLGAARHVHNRRKTPMFLHIAKTGGSTLEHCAPKSRKLKDCRSSHGKTQCGTSPNRCGVTHVPLRATHRNMAAINASNVSTFCVVRHPYARLVSLYRMEVSSYGSSSRMRAQNLTTGNCGVIGEALGDPALRCERHAPDDPLANETLLAAVETNRSALAWWARGKLAAVRRACGSGENVADPVLSCTWALDSCHSMPQVASVFFRDGSRACTHVVRYEALMPDLERLAAAYGPAISKHHYGCVKTEHRMAPLPPLAGARPLTALDLPVDVRREIDAVYAADMDAFGFCRF